MSVVKFGDVVKEVKSKIDRNNNPYEFYVAGDHMDSEDLHLHRKGSFATDDVGPAFIREFLPGQILYGSRRTYLKKVAVADFSGVTANTTFVLETKNEKVLRQRLIPFIMLSDAFTEWSISKSKGSTNPYVLFSDLAGFEFELPTIEEQDKLVNLLWSMDDVIVSYKDAIAKTDDLVKSQFIEMFGDPVYNTMDWPAKPIKDIAPESNACIPEENEYWWLNLDMIESYSGMLVDKVIEKADAIGNSTHAFDSSMVLYSKLRPYLNKAIVPDGYGYATTELVCLKPNPVELNKYFLFNLLRGDCFLNFATKCSSGAQMPRMPMRVLREFPCILPPMELQNKFVEFAEQSDKSKFALKDTMKSVEAMINKIVTNSFKIDREEG